MASYVVSSILIYKLIILLTNSILASWIGSIIFMTNPGIFYMQATPMGELPLIVMLIGSVYFLTKWVVKEEILYLIYSALFVLGGSLIRYDAWLLFILEVFIVILVGILKKLSFQKIRSVIILFTTLGFLGILMWVVWNLLIFKDPLYFLLSPYSAKAQQLAWLNRGELPSYHNLLSSLYFYTFATIKNTGLLFFIIACVRLLASLFMSIKNKNLRTKLSSSILLFTPFPFYVLTLYLGISIILVPELIPSTFRFTNFNVRYGLMMVPAVAVFIAIFFAFSNKIGRLLLLLLILLQFALFFSEGRPVSLVDAITGLSARRPGPANQFVAKNYDYGLIMFDDFSRSANPVDLGIPMQRIIYVGNHPIWDESLVRPTKYIRWFIIRHDENDVVWQKLQFNKEFLENYYGVYNNGKTTVYKRRDSVFH